MAALIVAGINGDQIPGHLYTFLEDPVCLVACSKSQFQMIADQFPDFNEERWLQITPIQSCFNTVAEYKESRAILFLLSGDPLFYGLGKRIKQQFPSDDIQFIPAVSYMQSCFANAGINWDDAEFISLHGRPLETINKKLNCRKLFIYTDPDNTPAVIAGYLIKKLGADKDNYIVHVGEFIGSEKQRFREGSLDEIHSMTFGKLNSMILRDLSNEVANDASRFGLRETDIAHSRGLITKSEVRAAVIHRLQLPDKGVFWDIGAGSGSISVETSRLYQSLSVFAIEKNTEQLANITENKAAYRCRNLHIVSGQAPECLFDLPHPDRIFIGGSGGRLDDIINWLSEKNPGPLRLVATAVLETTAERTPEILHSLGFDVDISIIETSRYHYPEKEMIAFNPIHIICGIRT